MQPINREASVPTILPFEDRNRMTRLYEEVVTRLEEMAMITARTLRMNGHHDFVVTFKPVLEEAGPEFTTVEILRSPLGSGCYDYRQGACFGMVARQTDLEIQK